ncbi:hypothetical protein KC331_g21770, partial [Hortaea werneckii]
AGSSKRTFLEHQQRQNGAQGAWGSQPAFGWQGSQYPPTMSLPVMDSMLYQMPLHHHYNAQQYFNQSVPSVLQPPFQHLGPTASGGQVTGPYGPYWHDGTSLIKHSYGNITLSRTELRGQAHKAQHYILLTSHRPSYMALNDTITFRMITDNLHIHPPHQLP